MALNFNLNSLFEPALLADEPWWSYILGGAGWTVALMLSSFALALALGIIVGTLRTSQNKFLSTICEVWIELFRNIPLIVQIFVWFYKRTAPENPLVGSVYLLLLMPCCVYACFRIADWLYARVEAPGMRLRKRFKIAS